MSAALSFAERLIIWQQRHGRHDLPWQVRDAYRVWVSEIMLQQTQVATVIPYFQSFIARFPTVADLAAAPLDSVLAAWSGLGYYSRARNLHRAAQRVMNHHHGIFPTDPLELAELPGVGRSTAAAIAVFSSGVRAAILDGNVKRVLSRWGAVAGWPGEKAVERELWSLADGLLPQTEVATYTQGLMDLGSLICTRRRPSCDLCPLQGDCCAKNQGRQSDLPTPKPRRNLPERHVVLLLIRHEGRVLLERRPPSGIWGGLWSLPEAPDTLSAADLCREHLGLEVDFEPAGEEFLHVFTHFRLLITPLPGRLRTAAALKNAANDWFEPAEIEMLGLPAPVRRILTAA